MSDPPETSAATRWRQDLARCGPRALLREQSLWAIAVLRFGEWGQERGSPLARTLSRRVYWSAFRVMETVTGIGIPLGVRVGGGLRIHHFGGIFVAEGSVLGAGCTLRHGVTIGGRHEDGPCPVLGDRVELGAYAQVLGGVHVGCGAKIGALSVVLTDVPAGATAVGNPARLLSSPDRAPTGDAASARG
ncbi:MAG: serine acetyltransferase [Solirubrobacterales bacterium]|nr:serine acetyltransferase [Solirubrobacterales bacterium]